MIDYILNQPLVVEVWGKQSEAAEGPDGPRETMSTKQLMNADSVSKANIISKSGTNEDEKYKILSEVNTVRKRNTRLNSRMVSVFALILFQS